MSFIKRRLTRSCQHQLTRQTPTCSSNAEPSATVYQYSSIFPVHINRHSESHHHDHLGRHRHTASFKQSTRPTNTLSMSRPTHTAALHVGQRLTRLHGRWAGFLGQHSRMFTSRNTSSITCPSLRHIFISCNAVRTLESQDSRLLAPTQPHRHGPAQVGWLAPPLNSVECIGTLFPSLRSLR